MDKNLLNYRMSRVKSKDTKPEILIRRLLHNWGLRFRLHEKHLPGKPDIVLKKHNLIILVNGCFWHGHDRCAFAQLPRSNYEFWKAKIEYNVSRENKNIATLQELGWRVLIVWTCEIRKKEFKERFKEKIDYLLSA